MTSITAAPWAGCDASTREWQQWAPCRSLGWHPDEQQRDLLFPGPRASKDIAAAKQFCFKCPVALACLADGVDDDHAVRAGLTADERRRLARGGAIRRCTDCRLPFVPAPINPTRCTGCVGRTCRESTTEDFKEEILAMHAAGASGEEICLHYGFTREEIRHAGKRWQVKLMRRGGPECGTVNGARAHYRAGGKPCRPCAAAQRERAADDRERAQRQRQTSSGIRLAAAA